MHIRAYHAPCTPCTQCHTKPWQAAATRHPISARLQQQHIAEQGESAPFNSAKQPSGSTRKEATAHKAKKVAADRTVATKNDASHLDEREVVVAQIKKKKKKISAVQEEEPTGEPTDGNDGVSTPPYTTEHQYPGLGSRSLLPQIYDESYEGYENDEPSAGGEACPIAGGTDENTILDPKR